MRANYLFRDMSEKKKNVYLFLLSSLLAILNSVPTAFSLDTTEYLSFVTTDISNSTTNDKYFVVFSNFTLSLNATNSKQKIPEIHDE